MKKQLLLVFALALMLPWTMNAQTPMTVQIGDSASTVSNYTLPTNNFFNYALTETIIDADEIDGPMTIQSISFYFATATAMTKATDVRIYLQHTDKSVFATSSDIEAIGANAVLVYSGNLNCHQGWNTFTFTTPFTYDGESNLMVIVHDNATTYDGTTYKFATTATTTYKALSWYSDSYNPYSGGAFNSSASKAYYQYRAVTRLNGTSLPVTGCRKVQQLAIDNTMTTSESLTLRWSDVRNTSATYDIYMITPTDTTVVVTGVTDTSYVVNTLSPNTIYSFGVVSNCGAGDLSQMAIVSGRTACAALTVADLPYTYGFEDATGSGAANSFDPCWSRHYIGGSTNYPYPYSTYKHSGSYGLYFTNSTTITKVWATLPEIDASVPVTGLSVGFWAYKTAVAGGRLKVGVMSNPDSISTFTPIASMQVSATSTWEYFEIPLSSYTGNGAYVAIMTDTNGTNLTCIDDVTLMVTPSCARPEAVAVSDINTTGATLTITDPTNVGNYRIDVTGDSVFSVTSTSTTYTFTGLEPDAAYTVAVSAICSDGNATSPNYVSFHTPCELLTVADLPYTYGFEDATGSGSSNNFSFCWGRHRLGTTTAYPYPTTTHHNGSYALYFYSGTTTKTWATLPQYSGSVNDLTVAFWAYKSSTATYGHLRVGVMTNPDSLSTFTEVARLHVSATSTWEYFEFPLTSYTGDGSYIAILADSAGTNYAYVDDVTLMVSPSCARIQGFTVSNPTPDGATVTINDPTNTNNYVITVTLDSSEVIYNATSTTFVITGLQPNTPYDISVYADCGDGTVTTPRDGSFRTACSPISDLPWTDDFEDQPASATPYCWTSLNGTNTVITGASNAHSGTKYLRFSGTTVGNIIALPQLSEELQWSDLALHFWARPENSNANCGTFSVGYFTQDTVWMSLDSCAYSDFATVAYVEKVVALTNVPEGAVVAFRQNAGATNYYWFVDDVELFYNSSCPRAQGIEVANLTESSADIVINDTMEVGNYLVTVIQGTDTTEYSTSAQEVNLTGLTPNTTYKVVMTTDCGDGFTLPYTINFTTLCVAIDSLPWTENFNSYTGASSGSATNRMDIPCWTIPYRYNTNYPYYYNAVSYNPDSGNCLYNYHSVSNPVVIVLPPFALTPAELMFTLDVRVATTGNGVEVGVVTNPNDRSTFTPVAVCNPTATGEWQTFHVTFAGVEEGLIAIRNTGSATTYLDNFVVDLLPPCVSPSSVVVSGITTTSATVTLADANNTENYWLYTSEDDSVQVVGNTITLTDLTPGADYNLYARTVCNDGELSEDSTAFSFRTLCEPLAIPFFENFDSLTTSFNSNNDGMLPCWDVVKNVSGAYLTAVTSGSYLYGTSGASLKFNPAAATARTILVLPVFSTPLDSLELTFQTRPEGTSASSGSFDVGYLADTLFVSLEHYDYSDFSGAYQMKAIVFDNAPEGARIAMRHNAAASNWYWFVDDVDVHVRPSCPKPQAVTVNNITATTADVHITDTNYVGSYILLVNDGVSVDTVYAIDTMTTLTTLQPATNYDIRVVALCADGTTTAYVDDEFLTLCAPVSDLPYVETFESWNTGSANLHPCWDHLYHGASGNVYNSYPYVSTSTSTAYEGTKYLYFYSYGAASAKYYAVAYMPEFTAPVNTLAMSFYYKASTAPASSRMYVGVSSSVTDTSTFVIIDSIVPTNTNWNYYEFDFGAYTGTGNRITLMQASTSASYISGYIDSIVVDTLGTCSRPNSLAISNVTETTADLNWVDINGAGDYRIYWTADNVTDSADVTGALNFTLTGLTPSTRYTVSIKRFCWGAYTRAREASFSTPCVAISVVDTLREDFEDVTAVSYSSSTGELPTCWEGWNASNFITAHVTDSGTYSYCKSGRQAITMTSGTSTSYTGGTDNFVRLPNILEPTNTLTVAFWMCTESSTAGFLEVGYLTGANYATDFVAIKRINASTSTVHSGNGHQDDNHGIFDTVRFDSVPAGNYPICFRWSYSSSYFSVCLDDIAVWTGNACEQPSIDTAIAEENSIAVNWVGAGQNYEVAIAQNSWTEPTTATAVTGLTHTFTGLTPGTNYVVGVRAVCGEDNYSDWTIMPVSTLVHPCAVPSNIVVSNVTVNSAVIDWTLGEEETAWELNVTATNYDRTFTVEDKPYTLTGLNYDVTYTVKVRAICGENNYSEWSATKTFTTVNCLPVTNVAYSNVTATSATISWTAPQGINNFELEYGQSGFSQGTGTTVTATGTSTTLTGLTAETVYDVYVRSVCAEGAVSEWSNVVSFETHSEGIDDVAAAAISLYPNPAISTVTLTGIEGMATVTVVDMNGRETGKWTVSDGELTIDVTDMAQGAYFVRIVGEQVNAIRKLIVR